MGRTLRDATIMARELWKIIVATASPCAHN
jgi:hypothetical protein